MIPSPIGPDLPGEIWKPVPGHEQFVEVSNLGRLRTTPRMVGTEAGSGYINANLKGKVGNYGASRGRRRNAGSFRVPVHRIVAIVFLGEPPEGKEEINHKDGNKLNNQVSNLEYCNRSHNMKHAYANGLIKRHNTHKLSDADYKEIRELYAAGGYTHETLAVKYGVSSTHIGYVLWRSPRKV